MSSKNVVYNFKILLLGEPAVGKTSLVKRFVHSTFTKDYILTVGVEPYIKYEKVKNKPIAFTIFDVAGQKQFNMMRKMFYNGAKGTLFVFDLTRKDTFDAIPGWLEDVKLISPNQEFILVGNKSDLKDRKIKKAEGEALASKLGFVKYIETSALTGKFVNEAFMDLGTQLFNVEEKKK
ncbi:MAG: GTP-binding protein [Candidatus Heimdallarchaeota archaeon]|nr:GTP-binding protein [Candidatus Heimdallarchaeota archaeon]